MMVAYAFIIIIITIIITNDIIITTIIAISIIHYVMDITVILPGRLAE